jgi:protein-S-isoprenylcysteine O-methyltransferase Ste14
MARLKPVLGTILFFLVAPGTVAGLLPWWISSGWHLEAPILNLELTRYVGAALACAGLAVLIDSFARFALVGEGTPAPVAPTRRLVVSGLYRHVRNPMYVAVVSIVTGQALLLGNDRLLVYAGLVWLVFHAFVVFYEEPALDRLFGEDFRTYRKSVPRWLPRLAPWDAQS